jgi:hypothetical protein
MEDIRIGRKTHITSGMVSLTGNVDKVILGRAPSRSFFYVSQPVTNTFWVAGEAMTTLATGLGINAARQGQLFKLEDFGDFVTGEIHAFCNANEAFYLIEGQLADK